VRVSRHDWLIPGEFGERRPGSGEASPGACARGLLKTDRIDPGRFRSGLEHEHRRRTGTALAGEPHLTGESALLVPRETPRLEQLIRATALKHAGAIDLLRVTDLSTAALEDWLTERLSDQDAGTRSQLAGRRRLRLDGLETVPLLAAQLVGDRSDGLNARLSHLNSHTTGLTRMEIPA